VTILLDAGPCLNFLAVSQQGILINLAQSRNLQLATARRVVQEVTGTAEHDPRFSRTAAPAHSYATVRSCAARGMRPVEVAGFSTTPIPDLAVA
jgi:hypothetical protein